MRRFYSVFTKILFSLAVLMILYSLALLFTGPNLSKMFAAILGAIIIFLLLVDKAFRASDSRKMFLFFRILIIVFVSSFIIIEANMFLASQQKVNYVDAIIVLGAGLQGDQYTSVLGNRLAVANTYLQTHPESIAVVSGGQGQGETTSEANVMRDYLLQSGIPLYKIKIEDKSTDTYTNFTNSKAVLDAWYGSRKYVTGFVTSDFHVFRAGIEAQKAGLISTGIAASTEWYLFPNYCIREYFAVIGFYLTGS
ncbi:MAG: YdcF family protein [Clostridia bacterium]